MNTTNNGFLREPLQYSSTRPRALNPAYVADPANATYYWEIYLTNGHPSNKPNFQINRGYSKLQGDEVENKVILLMNKFRTPLERYMYQADSILIFKNMPGHPKAQFPLLVEINKVGYHLYGELKGNILLEDFFQEFFDHFDAKLLYPPKPKHENDSNYVTKATVGERKPVWHAVLDHSIYRFANRKALLDFCREMADHPVYKFGNKCMHQWYDSHYGVQPELYMKSPAEERKDKAKQQQQAEESAQKAVDAIVARYNQPTQ